MSRRRRKESTERKIAKTPNDSSVLEYLCISPSELDLAARALFWSFFCFLLGSALDDDNDGRVLSARNLHVLVFFVFFSYLVVCIVRALLFSLFFNFFPCKALLVCSKSLRQTCHSSSIMTDAFHGTKTSKAQPTRTDKHCTPGLLS